ncbi:hypothetical protein GCM10009733_090520 [Nonomuraea maheshkhaliensis]|uniref:non-specific serine/threonine protein kinase n=1 Tax=Nonomuraea maheshkhaliensis TaxID=419590 RepID=A0ABN2H0F0_9ACTN
MPEQQTRLLAERYELISPLGRGTMGTVWRARDRALGREVAVKEIRQDPGLTEEQRTELRERMVREGRIAARISHPSVASIHDVLIQDDSPWIIMELIEARSLEQVIEEEGPLPPRLVAEIGVDLLGALRAAHAQGITHRDVKPGNVLITESGRVVLTDFGIAKAEGDSRLTKTGMVIGSPGYTAPERARGEYTGPESDIWSLGATLYFAVEGRPAYERSTIAETLAALLTESADPPTQAGQLRPVLNGLLSKDYRQRLNAAKAETLLRMVADTPTSEMPVLTAEALMAQEAALPDPFAAPQPPTQGGQGPGGRGVQGAAAAQAGGPHGPAGPGHGPGSGSGGPGAGGPGSGGPVQGAGGPGQGAGGPGQGRPSGPTQGAPPYGGGAPGQGPGGRGGPQAGHGAPMGGPQAGGPGGPPGPGGPGGPQGPGGPGAPGGRGPGGPNAFNPQGFGGPNAPGGPGGPGGPGAQGGQGPGQSGPNQGGPGQAAPNQGGPGQGGPNQGGPNQGGPNQGAPGQRPGAQGGQPMRASSAPTVPHSTSSGYPPQGQQQHFGAQPQTGGTGGGGTGTGPGAGGGAGSGEGYDPERTVSISRPKGPFPAPGSDQGRPPQRDEGSMATTRIPSQLPGAPGQQVYPLPADRQQPGQQQAGQQPGQQPPMGPGAQQAGAPQVPYESQGLGTDLFSIAGQPEQKPAGNRNGMLVLMAVAAAAAVVIAVLIVALFSS